MTWQLVLKISSFLPMPYKRCQVQNGSGCVRPVNVKLNEGYSMCSYCQDDTSKWAIIPSWNELKPIGFFDWSEEKQSKFLDDWVKKNPEGWHELHEEAASSRY